MCFIFFTELFFVLLYIFFPQGVLKAAATNLLGVSIYSYIILVNRFSKSIYSIRVTVTNNN